MIPMGSKLTFDLDAAARDSYKIVREQGSQATWWKPWEDLSEEERSVWHRSAATVVERYDPVTFKAMTDGLKILWKMISPVARPYLSLITRPDAKSESSCTEDGASRRGALLP